MKFVDYCDTFTIRSKTPRILIFFINHISKVSYKSYKSQNIKIIYTYNVNFNLYIIYFIIITNKVF